MNNTLVSTDTKFQAEQRQWRGLAAHITICNRCGMAGYEYEDEVRQLCCNCMRSEKVRNARVAELESVLEKFVRDDYLSGRKWKYLEFAKAMIGNAIIKALKEVDPEWELRPWIEVRFPEIVQ